MFIDKKVKKFVKNKALTILKTIWKVEEKEEGGDASCEKTAEAANREHQTN